MSVIARKYVKRFLGRVAN